MEENYKQSKNNLKAITAGFFLIIFTVALFFLKSYLFSGKDKDLTGENLPSQDIQKYKSISPQELLEKINSKQNIVLIDIREKELFERGHILDSKNILAEELEARLPSFDKNKEYFIVDDLGLTPKEIQAMEIMAGAGFQNTALLEGGISEWENQLNPVVMSGDPYSFTDRSKVTFIKSDDLKNLILEKANLYIIDLRTKSEFEQGRIKNAINIELASLESRRREIPIGKKIVLYDNDGFQAFQGAVRLFDMGILNVYALSDGFNVWKEKGFEIIK